MSFVRSVKNEQQKERLKQKSDRMGRTQKGSNDKKNLKK